MFRRKGNAVLEYGVLAALIIAALLIMHVFIQRRYQGILKASADRIGEQFSASSETTKTEEKLAPEGRLTVTEMLNPAKPGVYSWNTSNTAGITNVTQSKSGSLSKEQTRLDDYADDVLSGNITDPDLP